MQPMQGMQRLLLVTCMLMSAPVVDAWPAAKTKVNDGFSHDWLTSIAPINATNAITTNTIAQNAAANATAEDAVLTIETENLNHKIEQEKLLLSLRGTLREEMDAMFNERDQLAQAAREQEALVASYQTLLLRLRRRYNAMQTQREALQRDYVERVAFLRRVYQNPSAPLLHSGGNPQDVMRVEVALKSVLPSLRRRLDTYHQSVADVQADQQELTQRVDALQRESKELQAKIGLLMERLERKQTILALSDVDLNIVRRDINETRSSIALLNELVEHLDANTANDQRETGKERDSGIHATPQQETQESETIAEERAENRLATRDASPLLTRPIDVRAFPVNGVIRAPIEGSVVVTYQQDYNGAPLDGIIIEGRTGDTVHATFDGRVAFAGTFGRLGQVVIIEHEGAFHSVIRGLDKIDATVGQWVFAGESIGAITDSTNLVNEPKDSQLTASSPTTTDPTQQPASRIYLEIRRDGKAVNPLRWIQSLRVVDAG